MKDWPHVRIEQYLNAVARPSPLWAAGSVAAMTCAEGWSLVEMVAGLAERHRPSDHLVRILERSRIARHQLVGLAAEDAEAFRRAAKSADPMLHYAATKVPLEVMKWADEGRGLVRATEELLAYAPAAIDRAAADALFQAAMAITHDIIGANWPALSPDAQAAIRAELENLEQRGRHG